MIKGLICACSEYTLVLLSQQPAGDDFVPLSEVITFQPTQGSRFICPMVAIIDDLLSEPTEFFEVQLTPDAIGGCGLQTQTISATILGTYTIIIICDTKENAFGFIIIIINTCVTLQLVCTLLHVRSNIHSRRGVYV